MVHGEGFKATGGSWLMVHGEGLRLFRTRIALMTRIYNN